MPNIPVLEKVRALAAHERAVFVGGARTSPASQVTGFDVVSNKTLFQANLPAHVNSLVLAGDWLLAAVADGSVHVLNASGGQDKHAAQAHVGAATAVAWHAKLGRVATVGADGFLRLWALDETKTTVKLVKDKEWSLSTQALRAVAFDATGEWLAAAGDDGVVRALNLPASTQRDMAGHKGPVYTLAFTPRDGRLLSAGDDCLLRLWYLTGEIECEVRGDDDNGHKNAVYSVLFPPTPDMTGTGKEAEDRFFSISADGVVKVWRLEDRRRPRNFSLGDKALYASAFAGPASKTGARTPLGFVYIAGDRRNILRMTVEADGNPNDQSMTYGHGFDEYNTLLSANARKVREDAVKALAQLQEPEALALLQQALNNDRDADVRALAARELGQQKRRGARSSLQQRLNDDAVVVRQAALDALRVIEADAPLSPLRAALSSRFADARARALIYLRDLKDASPLVPGLIANGVRDNNDAVRFVAIEMLHGLHPAGSDEPLRIAFERGPADVRVDVLVRACFAGFAKTEAFALILARALDDEDSTVRRIAFAVKMLQQPSLCYWLQERDDQLSRDLKEVFRRQLQLTKMAVGEAANKDPRPATPSPTDADVKEAQQKFYASAKADKADKAAKDGYDEKQLEPLLTALSCRMPDTALRGARGLALLGDTRALGALLQLSRESDATLRSLAANSLQVLQDVRAKKRLVWMLDDQNGNVRSMAFESLSKITGVDQFELAESALRSSYEDMRVRGLDVLIKMVSSGNKEASLSALLGDALEDEANKVRSEAFRALWAWHQHEPAKALDRALQGRFSDVRLRAVTELDTLANGNDKPAWALERLQKSIEDRDARVAKAAYDATVKAIGKDKASTYLSAFGSTHASMRSTAAHDARHCSVDDVRSPLTKLLVDDDSSTRIAAIETLDRLLPKEAGPLYAGLQSNHYDLRVRAAELLTIRRDEQIIDNLKSFLADKELTRKIDANILRSLRFRASNALASLGSNRLMKYFATELLLDEQSDVREQAARGMCTSCRRGDEGYLLDALGHTELPVRSWAAEGLARLGDERAMPVLVGNLRHTHQPIREGSIIPFAALGPDMSGGLLQGLEDNVKEIQDAVFSIILAWDFASLRHGKAPELLTSALSSQRTEVRFAAARALELRSSPEQYLEHLIEVLLPPKPDKASEMKDWPAEDERSQIVVALASALASSTPEQRYAAAQALMLKVKKRPVEYFREAKRASGLFVASKPPVPDNAPRAPVRTEDGEESSKGNKKGWLRKLFASGGDIEESDVKNASKEEQDRLRRLAFGAYVGLVRQATAGDDEGHRVRRDAVERIVSLGNRYIGLDATLPAVLRALEDQHHLVRKAAFTGLKKLYSDRIDTALELALAAKSADIARAALDELAGRGESEKPRIIAALNSSIAEVRRYAFELLERLSPKGSLDAPLAALSCVHADLRLGVLDRLAAMRDDRVTAALYSALGSDHDDLRLRSAEMLAERKDEQAIDVLATFLRSTEYHQSSRAAEALIQLSTPAAVRVVVGRLEEDENASGKARMIGILGRMRHADAIPVLAGYVDDANTEVRNALFQNVLAITDEYDKNGKLKRKNDLALAFFAAAVASKDPAMRRQAAQQLHYGEDAKANEILLSLFSDRDVENRKEAVQRYSVRVIDKNAPVGPMEDIVRSGERNILLPASEAVAAKGNVLALRPLLLLSRAGEDHERPRALLALGTLGDKRALDELETVASGGTEDAPASDDMRESAVEALGRMVKSLPVPEHAEGVRRIVERLEEIASSDEHEEYLRTAALKGLRWIGDERARLKIESVLLDTNAYYDVRQEAARLLGELKNPASETVLAKILKDHEYYVRRTARESLAKILPDDKTRIAFLCIESDYSDVYEDAAAYLAIRGDARELLNRLGSLKNENMRRRLRYGLARRDELPADALAALLSKEGVEAIEEAAWLIATRFTWSAESQAILRDSVVSGARRLADMWRKEPITSARDRIASVWQRLLWTSARLDVAAAVSMARAVLGAAVTDAPASVRTTSVRILTKHGDASDVEAIAQALGDISRDVRVAAAASLAARDPQSALQRAVKMTPFDAVGYAVTATSSPNPESVLDTYEGRSLALPVLVGTGRIEPVIALANKTGDDDARKSAISTLGLFVSETAVTALKAISGDKANSVDIRKLAYRSYRRVQRKLARAKKFEAKA